MNSTKILPIATLEALKTYVNLLGHLDRVWCVTWNPRHNNQLVSCSGDKTVRIWKQNMAGNWICSNVLDGGHSRTIRSVAVSPVKDEMASAGFDSMTLVWEKEYNEQYGCIVTLEGHENEVKGVAYSRNGKLLATCSRDKSIWIWEVGPDGDFECLGVLQEHTQDVKMIVWHPQIDLLASASYDDTIKICREDDDDWTCVATLEGHESTVWAIDFNQHGSHLVSVSEDKSVRIWHRVQVSSRRERWECVQVIENAAERSIYTVSWAKNEEFGKILIGSGDNSIRLFENQNENGQVNYIMTSHIESAHGISDINSVAWNLHDSNYFASAGDDNLVKIWEVKT
ncbi:WD40 repeat-like protein [Neoconidiobolus thromboides FSU 785]|nr:WD40 repeat-like protein [Neoconidiobolus thromboides FSU 785]